MLGYSDTVLIRAGLRAMGYTEVAETGTFFLMNAPVSIPKVAIVLKRGAIEFVFNTDTARRATSREKYFIREAGSLSFMRGLKSDPAKLFEKAQ